MNAQPRDAAGGDAPAGPPHAAGRSRAHGAGVARLTHDFIRALRPVQWVKNVFVLAPLVFGLQLQNARSIALAAVAFGLFCLVSSAVYLLNDIMDRDKDALHPTKCRRPIASGALPVEVAWVGMAVLASAGILGGLAHDSRLALVLGTYFLLNVAYTFQLKHWAFVDTTCIALGFLLRVQAGGIAIGVPVSVWLLACTFLLASLLALGKRKHELLAVAQGRKAAGTRAVLDRYQVHHIDIAMISLAVVTVLSYSAYTLTHARLRFGTWSLAWTVPFVAIGLWRFFALVSQHAEAQSPTDTMVKDPLFLANIGAYSGVVTLILYFGW